ncbi:MAG: hypothetical protein M0006_02585 [Magnetospirillum sp.]|nr:hypothetical protein [Magnetospirillum sp.]
MSPSIAAWRARKADEAEDLHERIRAAVRAGRVEVFADPRVLDFHGSPVHSPWDHLVPLLALMLLALAVLLSAGMAFGIVAMTVGALAHLLSSRHVVAWAVKRRALAYLLESAAHWQALWQLGGLAVVLKGTDEPPCLAPLGDWRKFALRNLAAEGEEAASAPPDTTVPDHGG